MFGPAIVGERIRLAPPNSEMLPHFIRWLADTAVTRYTTMICPPSLEAEKEWFDNVSKSPHDVMWAVYAIDTPEERLIGTTGLHDIDHRNRKANSGNLIGEKSEWGKGYGSEVVRLRTRFAFEQLNLQKISTGVLTENIGSRRVLEKAGYRQIGTAHREFWREGRWHDMWLAEIHYEDWLAAQE